MRLTPTGRLEKRTSPNATISSVWKLMALGRCTSLWGGGLLRADRYTAGVLIAVVVVFLLVHFLPQHRNQIPAPCVPASDGNITQPPSPSCRRPKPSCEK